MSTHFYINFWFARGMSDVGVFVICDFFVLYLV